MSCQAILLAIMGLSHRSTTKLPEDRQSIRPSPIDFGFLHENGLQKHCFLLTSTRYYNAALDCRRIRRPYSIVLKYVPLGLGSWNDILFIQICKSNVKISSLKVCTIPAPRRWPRIFYDFYSARIISDAFLVTSVYVLAYEWWYWRSAARPIAFIRLSLRN